MSLSSPTYGSNTSHYLHNTASESHVVATPVLFTSGLSHACHMPTHYTLLYFITLIISGNDYNHKTPYYTIFPFPVMSPPQPYLKTVSSASRSHILNTMYSTSMGERPSMYSSTRYFILNMLERRRNLLLWLLQQQRCVVPFSEAATQQETHIQLPFWRTVHLKKTGTEDDTRSW